MTSEATEPLITADRRAAGLNCGGKATSLLEISRMVAVPEFIVVPQSWFALTAEAQLTEMAANWSLWDTVHKKSAEATQHLNSVQLTPDMRLILAAALRDSMPTVTTFAVRSSAAGEDGPQRSFAGLYDSFLDVSQDDLEAAVTACWRSWFSARAITYRDMDDWQRPMMSVVIQRMIDADHAGVAAVYGTTIEIESVAGTADRLVNGAVEPVRHVFSARPDRPNSPVERAAVAAWELRRQLANGDLEVEWAADQDGIWVVQARPLTAVPPSAPSLDWVTSSARPILRAVELYAATAPGVVVPLGPLEQIVSYYRTKRQPLYAVGAQHGCELGAALVVHFNQLGLDGPDWASVVRRLGTTTVVDVSPAERQVIIPTVECHSYLSSLCGTDLKALRTVVVREFIIGDCGVLSTVFGAGVRVEFSEEGLLALNRGFALTDDFTIGHDDGAVTVPSGWSRQALDVIDRVTHHFVDHCGNAVVEWVLQDGRPVLVDYSLVDSGLNRGPTGHQGTVISSGSCRGPAVVIDPLSAQALTDDSVAPVVSVARPIAQPSQASVAKIHHLITRLDSPPVVFVDRPYAAVSIGHGDTMLRDQLFENLDRFSPVQRLAWSAIQFRRYFIKFLLGVQGQVGAFREVLPEQPVRVLVGTALPR